MHGREECVGNVQELCASKYAPRQNWWSFVHCQNYEGRYKVGTPALALRCARSAKLDMENSGVGQCMGFDASGVAEEGVALLKESVQKSKDLGIEWVFVRYFLLVSRHSCPCRKSCTVIINDEVVCIRDGTWKECEVR